MTGMVLAVGTIALLVVTVSYISFRFPRVRPILDGEPIVVVQDGKILDSNLRRERLTRTELAEEARMQQIGSLKEISWAILEKSGQISFIQKQS